MEKAGKLYVIAGSSGVGKGTVLKRFFETTVQHRFHSHKPKFHCEPKKHVFLYFQTI